MQVVLDPTDLQPVITTVVEQVFVRLNGDADPGRLAYSESEAAALLGVSATSLRDERLRGRVGASMVGRKVRYTKQDLVNYLAQRRWEGK